MTTVLITGTGGADSLGHRIAVALDADGGVNVVGATMNPSPEKGYLELYADVRNKDSLIDLDTEINRNLGVPVDIVVNCAAVNILNMIEDIDEDDLHRIFSTNCFGILNTVQAFLPDLQLFGGTVLNIGSSAGRTPMTSSLCYNASKAAVEMMTLQMARELGRRFGITVFAICPNKLEGTGMSKHVEEEVRRVRGWTPEYAREYQLASLPAGQETDPGVLAEFIAFLLVKKERHKYLNGCIIPYGVNT